jgi:uncharacterized protein
MKGKIFKISDNLIFDAYTGRFFRVGKYILEALVKLGYLSNSKNKIENIDAYKLEAAKIIVKQKVNNGYFRDVLYKDVQIPDDNELYNQEITLLTLSITNSCNLRCKYCPYSCNSSDNFYREHSSEKMSIEVADKAIDLFISKAQNNSAFGFYGGEPLLNYKLIKYSVQRIRKELPDLNIFFTMTSNLTYLNKDIANFLSENKFILHVSIDGDKIVNDQNRIYPNGNGSYESVIKNLNFLKKEYPSYFKNYVNSHSVISTISDFNKIDDFFSNQLSDFAFSKYTIAENYNPHFYKQKEITKLQVKENLKKWGIEKLETIKDKSELKKSMLLINLILTIIKGIDNAKPYNNEQLLSFKGCVPGHKIFVNVQGSLSICDKGETINIGDVFNGLDYDYINKLMSEWVDIIRNKCLTCWMSGICNVCYLHAWDGKSLSKSKLQKYCLQLEKDITDWTKVYYPLKQRDDKFFDEIFEIDKQ